MKICQKCLRVNRNHNSHGSHMLRTSLSNAIHELFVRKKQGYNTVLNDDPQALKLELVGLSPHQNLIILIKIRILRTEKYFLILMQFCDYQQLELDRWICILFSQIL